MDDSTVVEAGQSRQWRSRCSGRKSRSLPEMDRSVAAISPRLLGVTIQVIVEVTYVGISLFDKHLADV